MANTIKHKRGSGSNPSASDLAVGELAIRTDTGVVFTKKDDGTVAEIAGGGGAEEINDLSDAVTKDSGVTIGLGTGALANDDDSDNNNTALGYNALNANTSGDDNTAVGFNAGKFLTTGKDNVLLGAQAGDAITTGQHNVIAGYDAGSAITTHDGNIHIGYMAGRNIQSDDIIAIGKNSLSNTSGPTRCIGIGTSALFLGGTDNTAVGFQAARSGSSSATRSSTFGAYGGYNNEGDDNVFFGYKAGYDLTTADDCVLIGSQAGDSITTASSCVVIGYRAAQGTTTNAGITAIGESCFAERSGHTKSVGLGYQAGKWNEGDNNTAIGYQSCGAQNTSAGNDNTGVGYQALYGVTSGSDNTSLGYQAGDSITTGSNNTVIGNGADASSATVSNEITLGNSSVTKLRVPGLSVVAQAESFAIGGAIYENAQSISADYSITSGNNAMSAGPITIDSGVTVTVTSGCTWTVV